MCGLTGYITHKKAKLTRGQKIKRAGVLKGLLLAMQNRGTHSTGVVGISQDSFCVAKKAKNARDFIATREFEQVVKFNPNIMIGHTRFATVGEKTDENAHPFIQGNIVGAHNGSVRNWRDLYPKGDVDSQAIFETLHQFDNKYEEVFPIIEGGFAITWLDLTNKNKLFLVKQDNPLFIIKVPEIQTYFWASESLPLQSIIASVFDITNKTIWQPEKDHVYEITTSFQIKKKKVSFMPRPTYTSPYGSDYMENGRGAHNNYHPRYDVDDYLDEEDTKRLARIESKSSANSTLYESVDTKLKKAIGKKIAEDADKLLLPERVFTKEEMEIIEKAEKGMSIDDVDALRCDNMTMTQIRKLKIQVEGDGCAYCSRPFDMELEGGVFWYDITESALCYEFADENEDLVSIFFIDEDKIHDLIANYDYEYSLSRRYYR